MVIFSQITLVDDDDDDDDDKRDRLQKRTTADSKQLSDTVLYGSNSSQCQKTRLHG